MKDEECVLLLSQEWLKFVFTSNNYRFVYYFIHHMHLDNISVIVFFEIRKGSRALPESVVLSKHVTHYGLWFCFRII